MSLRDHYKIAFILHFSDRETDKQTKRWTSSMH